MKKQSFIMGSAILIVSVFITKFLGMFYRIPLANLLGGTGMAYFSCAYSVFMPVFAIAVTGIPTAVARMVAENMALGRYRNVRKIRRVAMLSFCTVGGVLTVILILLSSPLCRYIVAEPLSRLSVIAISPCILIGVVTSVERGYYEGLCNMIPTAVSEIIEAVFKIVLGLGLAVLTSRYCENSFEQTSTVFGRLCSDAEQARLEALPYIAAASILGVMLANLLSCIYTVICYKVCGDGITKQMLADDGSTMRMRQLLKKLTRLCVPIAIASVITTLTALVDLITINRCLSVAYTKSPTEFLSRLGSAITDKITPDMLPSFIYGSYAGLAVTVFGIVPSLTAMFGKSILPSVSQSRIKGDLTTLHRSIHGVMLLSSIVSVPSGIAISVFSDEILSLLYGGRTAEIAASRDALTAMGPGIMFLGIAVPLFSVLQAIRKPDAPVKIMLIGCIVKLLGNLIMIPVPKLNIVGAGISTTACYAVICFLAITEIKKETGIKFDASAIIIKPLLSAILCVETAYLFNKLACNMLEERICFAISIIIAVNIYILSLCLLSVLPKSEVKRFFSY